MIVCEVTVGCVVGCEAKLTLVSLPLSFLLNLLLGYT